MIYLCRKMEGIDRTGRCTFVKVHLEVASCEAVTDGHLNINGGSGAPIALSETQQRYCSIIERFERGLLDDLFEISGIRDRNCGYSGTLDDLYLV